MKKLQILGVALVAVFAFAAMTVASASAVVTFLLAEWLVGGVGIPANTELLAEIEGELVLEDTEAKVGIVTVDAKVLCSGLFDGFLGANGTDLITEVLTLGGASVSQTGLVEPALACTNVANCEEPLVWALKLPWNSVLELMEEGTEVFFADLLTATVGNIGWLVSCMKSLVGEIEDECTTGTGVAEVKNGATDVEGSFSEAFTELAELKLAVCSLSSNKETGKVESDAPGLFIPDAGTLTVSE